MDTKKLRQKILDLAIHGKLVPQDPNDEPASVLLERIRAEKERLVKEGKIKKSKAAKTSDTPHYENVPFEVPSSWERCRLEEIMDFINGRAYKKEELLLSGKYRVLRVGNFFTNNSWYYSDLELPDDKYCNNGDLLYAWSASFGPKIWDGEKTIFHYHIWNVKYNQSVIKRDYLFYFLLEDKNQISRSTTGSTMVHVSMENMNPRFIPLPPLAEQQRIVTEIKHWFTLIDQIEQGKADLQTTIKQAKSKILDLAIHGKLVPQAPNDEPASELLKRINPKAEITCDNGHYQNLPGSWCVAPMGMLCSLSDGEKQTGVERINLDVKYLRGERDAKTLTVGKFTPANSLLILVDGENSGEVFRTPIEGYQGSTFKQLSIKDDMNTDYVLQVINLHRKTLRENKVGSAIPHLNKKLFKEIEVPIPPYKEQQRIVEAINLAFKHLDTIMESL